MIQIFATIAMLLIMSIVVLLGLALVAGMTAGVKALTTTDRDDREDKIDSSGTGTGTFRKIFKKGLWVLLLPVFLLLYGIFIGGNLYRIEKVPIESEKIPKAFDGYRIVQISDIHSSSFSFRKKSLHRAVDMINSLNPDLVVFTGDIITFDSSELNEQIKGILKGIKAKDGVLAVMGNHDYGFYALPDSENARLADEARTVAGIRDLGWRLMRDENIKLYRGGDSISVIGVDNVSVSRPFASFGNLDRALAGDMAGFKILLSHDPDHWRLEVLGKTDIDLTLSGHTHAMQFSIFGWTPSRYLFKEYRGLYKEMTDKGLQRLYVNIGLGETGFLARIGARPEITEFTLSQ